MLKPNTGISYTLDKCTLYKRKKNIYKKVKPTLRDVARKNGVILTDMVDILDFSERHKQNDTVEEELRSTDILRCPRNNRCYLFENHYANITYNDNGHYQYYSVNRQTGEYFYLDILDIFQIFTNKTNGEIMTDMITAYGFETEEEERKKQNKKVLENNIYTLKRASRLIKKDYPKTYKVANTAFKTLIALNNLQIEHLVGDKYTLDYKPFFSASLEHIGEKAGVKNPTAHISLLTLLGLIEKVPFHKLPIDVQERAERERVENEQALHTTHYIINTLTDELFKETEQMSEVAQYFKINLGNVGVTTIRECLGEKETNRVFVNSLEVIDFSILAINNKEKEEEIKDEIKDETEKDEKKNEKKEEIRESIYKDDELDELGEIIVPF